MRSIALVLPFLVLSACGGSSPPPPQTTDTAKPAASAAPAASAGPDDSAKKAAEVDKLTAEEAKTGTCDAGHQAAIEKLLGEVENGMKAENAKLVGKKVLALGPSAKSFEMSVTGRGTEVHVMAFGAKEISMDVVVGKEPATTMRSPFARSAVKDMALDIPNIGKVTDVQTDSRQVTMKPGQPLVVKVTGQGCAGIISFLKP